MLTNKDIKKAISDAISRRCFSNAKYKRQKIENVERRQLNEKWKKEGRTASSTQESG